MADGLTFLRNFFRQPGTVGAIAPSGKVLARLMVESVDWNAAKVVLEYGPGTGVFTEQIAKSRRPATRVIAIEQSPELAKLTQTRVPGIEVVQDSVANVEAICQQRGVERVDAVLCGLPWASFPESLQQSCFDAMLRVLAPGGVFATFAYWQGLLLPAGQRFRRRLFATFDTVQYSPTAFRNLPPAFVYRCRKN